MLEIIYLLTYENLILLTCMKFTHCSLTLSHPPLILVDHSFYSSQKKKRLVLFDWMTNEIKGVETFEVDQLCLQINVCCLNLNKTKQNCILNSITNSFHYFVEMVTLFTPLVTEIYCLGCTRRQKEGGGGVSKISKRHFCKS